MENGSGGCQHFNLFNEITKKKIKSYTTILYLIGTQAHMGPVPKITQNLSLDRNRPSEFGGIRLRLEFTGP